MSRHRSRFFLLFASTIFLTITGISLRAAVDFTNSSDKRQTIRVTYDFTTTVRSSIRRYTSVVQYSAYFESDGRLSIYAINENVDDQVNPYTYSLVSTRVVNYVVEPNSGISIQDSRQITATRSATTLAMVDKWYYRVWDPSDVSNPFPVYETRIGHQETESETENIVSLSFVLLPAVEPAVAPIIPLRLKTSSPPNSEK